MNEDVIAFEFHSPIPCSAVYTENDFLFIPIKIGSPDSS